MKKINKMILCLTIIFAMALSNLPIVNAGGMGISASTTSVKVGNTFSVTVVANGVVAQNLNVSGSGCTILNGIGNSLVLGESATINVRLDSASGCSVTIAGKYVDYSAAEEVFTPFSQTVSISAYVAPSVAPSRPSAAPNGEPKADPRSKDNNLSSLSIDQGKLTPGFNAETTSYSVNLPPKATSLTINALAADEKASVKGIGKVEVKPGDNKIEVVCTSEYGTDKVYTILVNVDEKPEVYMDYNGMKLGVVRNMNHISIPEGFNEIKMKYNKKEIPAWENKVIKKTIVYLSDEKNNKKFYLFKNGKVTSSFELQTILGRKFYLIDINKNHQNREGMIYKEIKIENVTMMGWTFKDPKLKDYSIFEVMDMDGNVRDYQYEKSQNSIQLYSNEASVIKASLMKDMTMWKYLSLGLGIILIGGISFLIYWIRKEKLIK
ncbi:MAG: cadherin-like beta sandwich domain-containing protein [Erysipelotrichaceae bacterium]